VPSARRPLTRLAVAACCGSLLLGATTGCSTTQEKAAKHQAESKRILDERAKRQREADKGDKQGKSDDNRGGGQ
jgi:hypothetical protein